MSSTRAGSRHDARDQRGAVAVMVAICAVMLLTVAALSVDLGNAWARARSVQKQVDIAALRAGALLPMNTADAAHNQSAIAAEVAASMNDTANDVTGQAATITSAQLIDNNDANGEIHFETATGGTCVNACVQMRVVAPPATVNFGLARVAGYDSTDVSRSATVRVESALPPGDKILPFWLPSGCGYGGAQADTTGGSGNNGNGGGNPIVATSQVFGFAASPNAVEGGTAAAAPTQNAIPAVPNAVTVSPVGTATLNGTEYTVAPNSTFSVTGWTIQGVDKNTVKATIRIYNPAGTFFVDFAAMDLKNPASTLSVPAFQINANDVTGTQGTWTAFALLQQTGQSGKIEYTSTSVKIIVGTASPTTTTTTTSTTTTSTTTTSTSTSGGSSSTTTTTSATTPTSTTSGISIGCVGQDRGEFGQLDSPRAGFNGNGQTGIRLGLNIAKGLDHELDKFDWHGGTPVKDCGAGTPSKPFIQYAYPDNVSVSNPRRNCIKGDTGNDGPYVYDGLVGTVNGNVPGRLVNQPTSSLCTAQGRSNLSIGGNSINNDAISCYLKAPYTKADIATDNGVTPNMLDQRIVDSPRFVYLPVVVANDRAQKDFQPILTFVPAFITDETVTTAATSATSCTGTCNGLEINGNSVKVLHVFVFNMDAVLIPINSDSRDFDDSLDAKIVRLVG